MHSQEFTDKIFAEMKDISEQLLANNKEMLALYKEKELIVNTMRHMLSEAGYNSDSILNDLQQLINDHQEKTVDKHNEA